jgi:hypothetical protein
MKHTVVDFRGDTWGVLVKHSPHWHKEINYRPHKHRLGMITGHKFFQDSTGKTICWPVVHWEGDVMGHLCHPVLIVPYRKKDQRRLRTIEMEES